MQIGQRDSDGAHIMKRQHLSVNAYHDPEAEGGILVGHEFEGRDGVRLHQCPGDIAAERIPAVRQEEEGALTHPGRLWLSQSAPGAHAAHDTEDRRRFDTGLVLLRQASS